MSEETEVKKEVVEETLSDKEINIRELSNDKKQLEKERDEMALIIKNLQNPRKEEEDIPLHADDLVEGKHLTKLGKKFKNLENRFAEQEANAKNLAIESQLRAKYKDFDSVVSGANFNELKEKRPLIARALSSSNDLFAAGALAYEEIKRSGIGTPDPYEKDKALAHENANKPRPLTSVSPQQGDSPLTNANAFANGLTDELRKNLWKDMQEAIKRA